MTVNPWKCELGKMRVEVPRTPLGQREHHCIAHLEKTEAVRKMSLFENAIKLRLFLGMVNQLAEFLPGLG